MASNTDPTRGRGVLAVAVTALLVASAVAAGVSLTAVGTASAAPEQISECTTIDEAGTYELTQNITGAPDGQAYCFRITASDVTFDGNGHAVETDPIPDAVGIVASGGDELTNVTVRSFVLEDDAVTFDGVSNGTVADLLVESGPVPTPGEVRIIGDNNTVTGLNTDVDRFGGWGVQVNVTGDDNRVLDTRAQVSDDFGVRFDGDRNVARNVTTAGYNPILVSGADNRVVNSSTDATYNTASVYLSNATNTTLVNTSLSTSGRYGAWLVNTTGSTFADTEFNGHWIAFESSDDNAIRNSTDLGLYIDTESDENTIHGSSVEAVNVDGESNLLYDNRIVNASDSPIRATGSTVWNVSERPAENVVGGDTIGGNYYANDEGTGYSQTCEDADGDGICDSPYRISEDNVDYAPLVDQSTDPAPVADGRSPTDPDDDGRYEDVDGNGQFTYEDVIVLFEYFNDPEVQNSPSAYDFDNSGEVNYNDVVTLFGEI